MPFSPETLEEKPYNICISCPKIGQTCDGPNFLAMSVDRWCEWCHLRRDHLKWKNQTIADKAGVSKMSIDRIMAGDVKDLRITTMQDGVLSAVEEYAMDANGWNYLAVETLYAADGTSTVTRYDENGDIIE